MIPFFEPVKFQITEGFAIHGFGIMVALGLWFGTNMAMAKAKRDGLDPDIINRVVTWMIVGIFVGGHFGHVFFYEPFKLFGGIGPDGKTYTADPMYLLKVWDGLSSFGGFIVTAFLCWLFFKRENKRVQKENRKRRAENETSEEQKPLLFPVKPTNYGDCVIYGFPMAFGLGRVGCFLAHDHPGIQTDFALGVKGICQSAIDASGKVIERAWGNVEYACHDLGLYEAIWACSLIPIVYLLDKAKGRFQGFYLALIPIVYAPFRILFDSLRTNDGRLFSETFYRLAGSPLDLNEDGVGDKWSELTTEAQNSLVLDYGLTPAQIGAIVLLTIGLTVFFSFRKSRPVREQTKESDLVAY